MKITHLILPFFLILFGCSSDDNVGYITINGKVERTINGDGIADRPIIIITSRVNGTGSFAYIEDIDSKEVISDENGDFLVTLLGDVDGVITVVHQGDENYSRAEISSFVTEPVTIKVDQLIKFKVYVNNINPINENDFIKIDFYTGSFQVGYTEIKNFGIENIYHPEEQLPSGGVIGSWEESSWKGINVNSIVYYNVPETAEHFKIRWSMRKNDIETYGLTVEIPYDIEVINSFLFEY